MSRSHARPASLLLTAFALFALAGLPQGGAEAGAHPGSASYSETVSDVSWSTYLTRNDVANPGYAVLVSGRVDIAYDVNITNGTVASYRFTASSASFRSDAMTINDYRLECENGKGIRSYTIGATSPSAEAARSVTQHVLCSFEVSFPERWVPVGGGFYKRDGYDLAVFIETTTDPASAAEPRIDEEGRFRTAIPEAR